RIVFVSRTSPGRGVRNASPALQDYVDFRAQQRSFEELAAFTAGTIFVSGDEGAERYDGSWITANMFTIVGVRPILGRTFRAGEDTPAGEKVAILSYAVWHDRYGADPRILEKTIRVNGTPTFVVGVMPDGFAFPNGEKIWLP